MRDLRLCLRVLAPTAVTVAALLAPQAICGEELSPIEQRIVEIARTDSTVMDHLDHLCNRIGPRLSGSRGLQRACVETRDYFAALGLEAWLEEWDEWAVGFDRGPARGRVTAPEQMVLEFATNAWTPATPGERRQSERLVDTPRQRRPSTPREGRSTSGGLSAAQGDGPEAV